MVAEGSTTIADNFIITLFIYYHPNFLLINGYLFIEELDFYGKESGSFITIKEVNIKGVLDMLNRASVSPGVYLILL